MKQQDLAATFQRITCFLLDMDGTIYLGDQLLDGTLEFLDALRTRNGNLPISISRTATVREDLL